MKGPNIIGLEFRGFTVTEHIPLSLRKTIRHNYRCICNTCGTIREFQQGEIVRNRIDCRCHSEYKRIKHDNAGSRNIKFDILEDEIWELLKKQNYKCALSGINIYFNHTKDKTASLDRIDSTKGYIKNNIQWVHKDINKMKMDFPENKFIYLCKMVSTWSF